MSGQQPAKKRGEAGLVLLVVLLLVGGLLFLRGAAANTGGTSDEYCVPSAYSVDC